MVEIHYKELVQLLINMSKEDEEVNREVNSYLSRGYGITEVAQILKDKILAKHYPEEKPAPIVNPEPKVEEQKLEEEVVTETTTPAIKKVTKVISSKNKFTRK